MKAFILAAGIGERLKPLTNILPKPLLPIMGRPVICFQLAALRKAGINDIIINTYHLGDKIIDFFEAHKNFGFNIHFSKEPQLLGTGGALKHCSNLLGEPFVLLNADIISDINITILLTAAEAYPDKNILVLSENSLDDTFSVALKNDSIVDFSNLANSGIKDNHQYIGAAVIIPQLIDILPTGISHLVKNGFLPFAKAGELFSYKHQGWWFDTGTKQRRNKAEKFLQSLEGVSSFLSNQKVEPKLSYLFSLYKNISEV